MGRSGGRIISHVQQATCHIMKHFTCYAPLRHTFLCVCRVVLFVCHPCMSSLPRCSPSLTPKQLHQHQQHQSTTKMLARRYLGPNITHHSTISSCLLTLKGERQCECVFARVLLCTSCLPRVFSPSTSISSLWVALESPRLLLHPNPMRAGLHACHAL